MSQKSKKSIQKIFDLAYSQSSEQKPEKVSGQLQLQLERPKLKDRNADQGGRSFYFFDFDDNIAFLSTNIYLRHVETGEEISLNSGEFSQNSHLVGKQGPYKNYKIDYCDETGSFRNFRDKPLGVFERLKRAKQSFETDLDEALGLPDLDWKGPSWDCFYHAVYNHRPMAIITARGHAPETLKKGIGSLVKRKFLPNSPNYLGVYPVMHPETREQLGGNKGDTTVAELKKRAIWQAVEKAFQQYGFNNYHRFGISDDDPNNVKLAIEAMRNLKERYKENSFFVIDSSSGELIKREVFLSRTEDHQISEPGQLNLFT